MKAIMFPGQGAQHRGMGKGLFQQYRTETLAASEFLGYDLEELCLKDPKRELGKTQFTQPALYTVNAFRYYEQQNGSTPDYLIGHSLGEYNALLSAGAFDFMSGLKLVQKRGELMAAASGGGMAAVLGLEAGQVREKLKEGGYGVEVANYNTPTQIVIAGKKEEIDTVVKDFDAQGIKIIPLFVSAPFHSKYMANAASEFEAFLEQVRFSPLKVPVIANATARPYDNGEVKKLLATQIASSVLWVDTIAHLLDSGVGDFEEIGGDILTKMVIEIKNKHEVKATAVVEKISPEKKTTNGFCGSSLGSASFREEYKVKYAYMTGAMYKGIASKEMVLRLAKSNMLGFLGTAGMSLRQIEEDIRYLQGQLTPSQAYGLNLIHHLDNPDREMDIVSLYLNHGIHTIEAAAFMTMTPALVYYRLKGLKKMGNGEISCTHRIVAKVSRPEVAKAFMSPAPERIVNRLLEEGLISIEESTYAKKVPMSYDICVEADSGGHTDRGIAMVLLPAMQQLRDSCKRQYAYDRSIRVGLAGGIGTPQSIVCAFMMGADFVLTGSINQCTVEAGTSESVKEILQEVDVRDTDYAPAGDMFEIGAKVQVLKKGVLFPVRANKLFNLYQQYNAIEEIPEKIVQQLENRYFEKTLDEVWKEVRAYKMKNGKEAEIEKAEKNPRNKMALIFRAYFGFSSRLAFEGNMERKVNFQVHTGSSMGAFNQWVKGSRLENWRERHTDEIGTLLMEEAAKLMKEKLSIINN